MSVLRSFVRWLSDWRTGAVLLGSLIAGAVIALVIVSGVQSHDALEARNRTAAAASRRIDLLQAELRELRTQLVAAAETNGARIGELLEQVAVLQEQVRQLGGDPVVVVTTTTTTSPRRSNTTTTTTPRRQPDPPSPTTSTTTTTTTQPDRGTCLGPICLGA
jgi:hypothetical protein